jgi:hypothetical protein
MYAHYSIKGAVVGTITVWKALSGTVFRNFEIALETPAAGAFLLVGAASHIQAKLAMPAVMRSATTKSSSSVNLSFRSAISAIIYM